MSSLNLSIDGKFSILPAESYSVWSYEITGIDLPSDEYAIRILAPDRENTVIDALNPNLFSQRALDALPYQYWAVSVTGNTDVSEGLPLRQCTTFSWAPPDPTKPPSEPLRKIMFIAKSAEFRSFQPVEFGRMNGGKFQKEGEIFLPCPVFRIAPPTP